MEPQPDLPVNREAAFAAVQQVADPGLRRVLTYALETATARLLKWDGQTQEAFTAQLPEGQFDLLFFVRTLEQMFSNRSRLIGLLEGQPDDWSTVDPA